MASTGSAAEGVEGAEELMAAGAAGSDEELVDAGSAGSAGSDEELVDAGSAGAAAADEDVEEVIAPFSATVRSLTSKLLDD
ncbi:hypothetical protein AB0K47_24070 [Streptomyces tirandamycinicus]|uniref:hypothetical protein n=1 Tax=Streptomyces tirandamycinicus TaxID=2174846 RepID=UPI0034364E38